MTVVTWKFDESTNKKLDWDKSDPREFADIAIDYKITPEAVSWLSDERNVMGENNVANEKQTNTGCQLSMLKANATFIRATVYCRKDYMDSPAGYYALAMSRQCAQSIDEDKLRAIAMEAMRQLDVIAKQMGRAKACNWVDGVEKEVLRSVTK
jgi:hypothetical protein